MSTRPLVLDPDRVDAAEGRRWVGCVAVIAALHVAAGAGMLTFHTASPAPELPPAIVMIDLPPAEPAPPAPAEPAPPPPEPVKPEPPPPPPEPPPPEPPPPEPPPLELPPPEPPPPVEIPKAPLAPKPEVALPPPKPKPVPKPRPKPVVKKVEPAPPAPPAPPPPAPVPVQAAPAPPAPPPPAAPVGPPPDVVAAWTSRLMTHLQRFKRYPVAARMRNEQGTVYVRFRMDRSGNVLSARIERASGHQLLDSEATALLERAAPLPALPPEMPEAVIERVLPIPFTLR